MNLRQLKLTVVRAALLALGISACRSNVNEDPTPPASGSAASRTGTGTGTGTSSSQGSKDATASGTSATTKVTYTNWAREYLESACVKCHGRGGDEPDLSTESAAKAAAKRSLRSMEDGDMPPSGPPKSQDLKKMKEWVSGGAL